MRCENRAIHLNCASFIANCNWSGGACACELMWRSSTAKCNGFGPFSSKDHQILIKTLRHLTSSSWAVAKSSRRWSSRTVNWFKQQQTCIRNPLNAKHKQLPFRLSEHGKRFLSNGKDIEMNGSGCRNKIKQQRQNPTVSRETERVMVLTIWWSWTLKPYLVKCLKCCLLCFELDL